MRSLSLLVTTLGVALGLAGCGSSGAESDSKPDATRADAAEHVLKAFYAAANDANGRRACGYLTPAGIQQIVRVGSRAACIRTIGGLTRGSFASGEGDLLDVEHVEEKGGALDVEAEVKGRSGGTYRLVTRGGELLIDSFQSEEK